MIVSPYFPPSMVAGVHRARHLAKHLPAAGWTPIVLCVDEAFHEERLDPDLASLVPAAAEVVKVSAVSPRLTRPLGVGEISLRAFASIRRHLFRLLGERPIGAVLITGSPYYPMMLAPVVRRRFGVPVVLDFQDPWVSSWGAHQSRLSKAGLSHALAVLLEPKALRGASYVTSVSKIQNDQMAERYPWLDRARMAAIPIGSDPEDFDAIRSTPGAEPSVELDRERFNLSCVGALVPRSRPVVEVFVRAVARLQHNSPRLARTLRINFIGTSNQSNGLGERHVEPLARSAGVDGIIREAPQRIPYLDALRTLAASNGLLMIGSDEPHYTASKIYPYLMSGRPYVSVFHRASSAHEILSGAGGGVALAFSTPGELESLEGAIAAALDRLVSEPSNLGQVDPAAYAPYEAREIAGQYAHIFEGLVQERRDA